MWLDLVWLHRHLDPRWWRDMILIDVMFVALFFHRHWSCEKRKTVDIEIQCLLRFRFVYQRRECGPKNLKLNITNQILVIYIQNYILQIEYTYRWYYFYHFTPLPRKILSVRPFNGKLILWWGRLVNASSFYLVIVQQERLLNEYDIIFWHSKTMEVTRRSSVLCGNSSDFGRIFY